MNTENQSKHKEEGTPVVFADPQPQPHVPNTFGIPTRCRALLEYDSVEQLISLLPRLHHDHWLHVGSGSNLLFVDDYDGIVLHSCITGREVKERNEESIRLRVGAGEVWDELVGWCVEQGYYGLENLSLIPGEVGASAVQNIGAYGVEACDRIVCVETVEVETGQRRTFQKAELRYAYRDSAFKHELRGRYIVTHVTFDLALRFAPDLEYGALRRALEENGIAPADVTPQALRQLIIDVRRAKLPDPAEVGSAGSFFMNPVVSREKAEALLQQYPTMPHYAVGDGVKIPAGWMIDQCGWKGRALGPAGVYKYQALVLVNLGGATGRDIVRLSDAVRADVKERFGIEIFPEVNFIGKV